MAIRLAAAALCAVAVALALCAAPSRAQGTCVLPAGFFTYEEAVSCIRSIPYDPAIAANTIDSLRKSVPVFAFQWPAANIPASAAGLTISPVDLLAGLEAISKNAYQYDIDFQNDLVALYNGLCDAHSLYFRPSCYAALTFWQPFSLVSIGGGTEIFIAPYFAAGVEAAYESLTGLNVTQFANARVVDINGVDATAFITAYARDHVGLSKDLATRFNVALTRFEPTISHLSMASGSWQKRRGLYFSMPLEAENVTYTLALADGTTQTFTAPWIASSSTAFNGTSSFLSMYYANGGAPSAGVDVDFTPSAEAVAAAAAAAAADAPVRKASARPKPLDVHFNDREKVPRMFHPEDASFTLISFYEDMSFWKHPDGVTLVMYLSTFEPDSVTNYMNALVAGITAGQGMGLTRFILDFTDNGGGDICFGIAVLDYLFGQNGDNGLSPTDMPANAFTLALSEAAASQGHNDTIWSAYSYQTYPNEYAFPNANITWIQPPTARPRGSTTQQFSQMIDLSAAACAGYNVAPLAKPFPSDQMLIVTRGFCGSTCALVSGHAHLFHGVAAVTLGGLQTQAQQQIFSFPGLQVVDSPDFYLMWQELGFNTTYSPSGADPNEMCPRLLGTTAGYRYCIREIYPPYEVMNGWPMPLEYVFTPSDYHLYFNQQSVLHSEIAWLQVTQFFPPSKAPAKN